MARTKRITRRAPVIFGENILPFQLVFSSLADGELPAGWIGSAWAIASEKAIGTPTGTEKITNGDFEAGDPPTGWNTNGQTVSQVADERTGGSGSKAIAITVNGDYNNVSREIAITANRWYLLTGWIKKMSGTGSGIVRAVRTVDPWDVMLDALPYSNATEWALSLGATYLGVNAVYAAMALSKSGDTYRFDDFSCKLLDSDSLIAYLNKRAGGVAVVKAAINVTVGAPAGVVGWWDGANPLQNCLLAHYNGVNAVLEKYVGAVRTVLINAAAENYAGASIEIRRGADNTFQLYFNNAQIGADQTISDTEIINNKYFGMFSTYSGNEALSFELS